MGEIYTPCGENIKNVQHCKNECTEDVFRLCIREWEEYIMFVLNVEKPLDPNKKDD